MGGSSVDDGWELTSPSDKVRTAVLVGRTGNGKSATGNSILGKKSFKSEASFNGVTSTCELQTTILGDGQTVNVIDTPGLSDLSMVYIGKEIVKCIEMAINGIHAFLLVFSVRSRFSNEEADAICSLQALFGSDVAKQMIVVFTGGDDLEYEDKTLEDYLSNNCPEPIKEIIALCENRCVLFDNKTKDEGKREKQVNQLFSLVEMVVEQNRGLPFSNDLFAELKGADVKLLDLKNDHSSYDEKLKRVFLMIESRLKEAITRLEKKLEEEQAARLRAEEKAAEDRKISQDELNKLRDELRQAEERNKKRNCVIL